MNIFSNKSRQLADEQKKAVAKAAIEYIQEDTFIGVGTGSTVNYFIEQLASLKNHIKGVVSSSQQSTEKLKSLGIEVFDMNFVNELSVYVDGADEVDPYFNLIKGGGGALTREKIVASLASQFVCIVDPSKIKAILGKFPLPLEVVPMARSHISRQIIKSFSAEPIYRDNFITDNHNHILDIHCLDITNPDELEKQLNQIPGVVCNGIFAQNRADVVLVADENGSVNSLSKA